MPRTTNPGVHSHRHLLPDLATITVYQVYPGGAEEGAYSSIQAAIDQAAIDGHEDNANPAAVLIRAGHYTENVFLRKGIYLSGLPPVPNAVVIHGTVICNLSAGPPIPPIFNAATAMIGISISVDGPGDGLIFEGTNSQLLFLQNGSIITLGGGRGIVIDNPAPDSQIVAENLAVLSGVAGGPNVEISAGQLIITNSVWQNNPPSQTMIVHSGGQIVGSNVLLGPGSVQIEAGGNATFTDLIFQGANLVNDGSTLLQDIVFVGAGGPFAIQGTSSVTLAGMVSFAGGATGFATPPTRIPADEAAVAYVDTTAPGTWAGTPVSLMEATNRLATAVSGLLGGAIP